MNKIMEKIASKFDEFLISDSVRKRVLFIIMVIILFVISTFMFIFNIMANIKSLVILTGLFSIALLVIIVLFVVFKKENFSLILFNIIIIILFSIFLIYGGVEGFSPIWILLMPSTILSIYGIKKGLMFCISMLLIVIILLWTPVAQFLQFDYTDAFLGRFPIVYISFTIMAIALELERQTLYKKLNESRKRLEHISNIDDLTKLNNRRSFNTKLKELWDNSYETGDTISILMIDIDYFKLYNDNYGHLDGDIVLIEVANIIASTVSSRSDIVSRWGGEEFIVLLPSTPLPDAKVIAENIITAVNEKKIPHEFSDLNKKHVTVSIGVASLKPDGENIPQELMKCADEALYIAKEEGRDRIGVITPVN